jgi:hypothetical protein
VALAPGGSALRRPRSVWGVVSQSGGKASTEIYYAPIRPNERRRIKPAIDTLVERWSDAVVGVLLIVVLHALHVRIPAIAIVTAILAGAWMVFCILLNREFGTAFEKALSSRCIHPDAAPDALRIQSSRRALRA